MKKHWLTAMAVFMLLSVAPAFASTVEVQQDGTRVGQFSALNFSGFGVSRSGGTATILNGVFEGSTADDYETSIAVVDPTADRTFTLPDDSGYAMISTLATNKTSAANSIWFISNGMVLEGATADAFETTLAPADPTADQTATIPNFASGFALVGSTLTTNTLDGANSVWFESGALVFEGATANGFEGRITSSDWTADQVHTLPDMTGTLFMSTLASNNLDAANSVWAASNGIVFEGATADAFELTLSPADVGADVSVTLPTSSAAVATMYTSLVTNSVDAANSVTGTSNGFIAEGATADTFETTFTFADPTADQTVTVPATAGAAGTLALNGATVVITAGTTPTLTVPLGVNFIATDTITTDNQDQTITFSSGGSVGQVCTIIFQTDSGGSNDEVITLHTTLTNTTGTLTLANLTANRYSLRLQSDGTVWNEVSRTGAQT